MERREWVTIQSAHQKIFGVLHRPPAADQKLPVVVILHGFASSKLGTNRSYVTFAEKLAERGIAALRFDFRGSGDSEGSLASVSFENLIEDALAAYQFVEGIEEIDPKRIGLFGSSLGGSIGVLSAERFGKIKSMVLWSPLASGELWVRDFMSQHPEFLKSDPKDILTSYRGIALHPDFRRQFGRMSAAATMEKMPHIPLLHMHGESDTVVSLLHQQVYKMHCEGREGESRFISYPGTEHALGTATVFPEALKESLSWFKHHL